MKLRNPGQRIAGFLLLLLIGLPGGCTRTEPHDHVEPPALAPPNVTFTDITARAGLRFTHVNGAFGRKLMPESLGSGCAFFDYDGDGHPDLLLVNGRPWPGFEKGQAPATLTLYRNQGDGTFVDVTAEVGLAVPLYGMGVAVGDFDNDGLPDLFITALGGSRLFRNTRGADGMHRFVDVTTRAGDLNRSASWPDATGEAFLAWQRPVAFPSSAAFVDFDKDGLLDLFVCSYVEWSPQFDLAQGFSLQGLGRAYGPPTRFDGTHCQLFRNQGDGTFRDVSRQAGVEVLGAFGRPIGKARWGSRLPTWTRMAGPILSWRTTRCATSCSIIRATAPSRSAASSRESA